MADLSKKKMKWLIIGGIAAVLIIGFVLLTTIGKPLLAKSITAEKLDDFKNVCYNNKIVNAAAYTTPKNAVIAAFYERPTSKNNPWTNLIADNSSYYASYSDFVKTNVVACFEHQPFEAKQIAVCNDIKLMSAHYKTIFYEAKTGKKIGEGKTLVNDSAVCPSYVVYDIVSRETAKIPVTSDMREAIKTFTEQ